MKPIPSAAAFLHLIRTDQPKAQNYFTHGLFWVAFITNTTANMRHISMAITITGYEAILILAITTNTPVTVEINYLKLFT